MIKNAIAKLRNKVNIKYWTLADSNLAANIMKTYNSFSKFKWDHQIV